MLQPICNVRVVFRVACCERRAAMLPRRGSAPGDAGNTAEVAMESRVKLLGHPVHPMLIVYPLGLLSAAVIFDLLYVVTGNPDLSTFSFWALVAGLVGGLAAAIFGLI